MGKKIVAGNWKMNKSFEDAEALLYEIMDEYEKDRPVGVEVVICPPSVYLELGTDITNETELSVGAQNVSQFEKGAYTGEISAEMLKSIGVAYCIIGHSERRKYFGENNDMLSLKVERLLENEIKPIFCVGESLSERESGDYFEVVDQQIKGALFHLTPDEFSNIVIAYEPVWAIGTGKTATPQQAQEMHSFIRALITKKYGKEIGDDTSILYGGSCNGKNARELFANPDVDGGLIGGASLNAEEFLEIANSF